MPSIVNFLAPMAMLLPLAPAAPPQDRGLDDAWAVAAVPSGPPMADPAFGSGSFSSLLGDDAWNQIRIEQRMIIRIAPGGPGGGLPFTPPPGPPQPLRFYERKTDKCLAVANIASVRLESPDRLLLITRGRKIIGASLDKSCRARDFYQGFYVERNEDGRICAGRDTIHSRAGATCGITRLRELVPDDD